MTAKIIDGKAVAQQVRKAMKPRVDRLLGKGIKPGLAVILVGSNPASKVYVGQKTKACNEVGVHTELHEFPENVDQESVLQRIHALDADSRIHGIIVQLPLSQHLDVRTLLESIAIEKDVDGFHLYNVGGLVIGASQTVAQVGLFGSLMK